jgi:hypothetical protein
MSAVIFHVKHAGGQSVLDASLVHHERSRSLDLNIEHEDTHARICIQPSK